MGNDGQQKQPPINLGKVPNLGALGKGKVQPMPANPPELAQYELTYWDETTEFFLADGYLIDQAGNLSFGLEGKLVMSVGRESWRVVRRVDFQAVK